MSAMSLVIEERLKRLTDEPGVYLMKHADGEILYVGKARSLRNRVRSYFQSEHSLDFKTRRLVREIGDLETIVTASEREALILEDTLIKRHQPRYNVRLRDDKRYPYLKLTDEPFPRLILTRQVGADAQRGARYFGPYVSAYAIREARRTIQRLFRIRTCPLAIRDEPVRRRPCLDHFIGLCDAPCVSAISRPEYDELADQAAVFLRGQQEDLLPQLRLQMAEASRRQDYERAARLRDRIQALERLTSGRKTLDPKGPDQDAIGLAQDDHLCAVQIFFIRGGKLVGRDRLSLETAGTAEPEEILDAFVKQYYGGTAFIPREILLPHELSERKLIETWLSERRGKRTYLRIPQRGAKAHLMETVRRNAELALQELKGTLARKLGEWDEATGTLREILGVDGTPSRIEGFDISNFQGRESVASMVVFEEGVASRRAYRRFRIAQTEGPDDFAMLAEAVRRRMNRALNGDNGFLPLPDLLLIDGGKGQLGAVRAVLRELSLESLPTLALAKEDELLFMEGHPEPIALSKRGPALQLLQRVRDEAHRFALTYHRSLRGKRTLRSMLDGVPGIGPARKRALLAQFGSLKRLRQASQEELLAVPGIPRDVADHLFRALRDPHDGGESGEGSRSALV